MYFIPGKTLMAAYAMSALMRQAPQDSSCIPLNYLHITIKGSEGLTSKCTRAYKIAGLHMKSRPRAALVAE